MKTPRESKGDYVNESAATSDHTFRAAASQCLAALATNLVKAGLGSFHALSSILLAEFYKPDAEIKLSLSELTWFGSILMGLLAHNIGPRRCLLVTSILFITSGIIFYFATNSVMLLLAQAIAGIAIPATIGPGNTYIVEITQPYLRSGLMASTNLSTIVAAFCTILYSNWIYWRVIVLINIIPSALGLLAMCMIPESPHWLANKGKFNEAEKSLLWLRGWTTLKDISHEFNSLKETYKIPERKSSKNFYKSMLKPYFHRIFLLPLASVACMFFLHSCTGFVGIIAYLMIIFKNLDAPIDSHFAASLFDVMRMCGAVTCILTVHYTGKRKLIFISLSGGGLGYLTIATLLFLKAKSTFADYIYIFNWASTIILISTTFVTSAGIDKIIFMYNAELFPTKFRNVGSGIGLFVFAVCSAIMTKSYLYLVAAVSLSGAFFIFGICCFVCCITFYFVLPETEGKTLQELEAHYAKTRICAFNSK